MTPLHAFGFERSVDASLILKSAFVAIRRMNGFIPKRLPPFLRRCDDQGARDGPFSSPMAGPHSKAPADEERSERQPTTYSRENGVKELKVRLLKPVIQSGLTDPFFGGSSR